MKNFILLYYLLQNLCLDQMQPSEESFYLPKIKPKLIAFDLDGTLWYPEMYQLYSGSPFTAVDGGRKSLLTKSGTKVNLLGSVGRILDELKTLAFWKDTKIAWVSTCDEPSWAKECLKKFRTTPNDIVFENCADSSEIHYGNKKEHFRNIKKQFPGIGFEEMIFFDNQMDNIRNVKELGVFCVYCPDGVTEEIWVGGLKGFESGGSLKKEKKNK